MMYVELRNIALFCDLFLPLGFELVNVFLNVGSNNKHIIDEFVGIRPCFRTVAIVLNQNVFFFESMVDEYSGLLGS